MFSYVDENWIIHTVPKTAIPAFFFLAMNNEKVNRLFFHIGWKDSLIYLFIYLFTYLFIYLFINISFTVVQK